MPLFSGFKFRLFGRAKRLATYAIAPSTTSVNESGTTVTWTVTTTNVPNGTTLYWTNSGTATAGDFSQAVNSGSVTINSNTATITLTVLADQITEGSETVILQLRTLSTSGLIVATAATVTIADTSQTPTYAVSASAASITEGSSVTFTITTTSVFDGTTLYWTNDGTTGSSDFVGGTMSGSVTINSNTATVTLTTTNESAYEGSETIVFNLRTGSTIGTLRATTTVTLVDSAATYSVSVNVTAVTEGGSATYTVTTTNVQNGTTLYWTNAGTTIGADFTDGANSGSFAINNNSGSFTRTFASADTTEGSETLIIQIRTGSTGGSIVATAATVTVSDASPSYSIYASSASVSEGDTVTYTVNIYNGSDGTYYYTNSGTTNYADFSDNVNDGSFTVTNGTGSFSRTLRTYESTWVNEPGNYTEGTQTIVMNLRSGSTTGTILATAGSVSVSDTYFSINISVVGGGGGGGTSRGPSAAGGGGGGGGLNNWTTLQVQNGATYTVTVGAGGVGSNYSGWEYRGGNGSNSSFAGPINNPSGLQPGPSVIGYGGGGGGGFYSDANNTGSTPVHGPVWGPIYATGADGGCGGGGTWSWPGGNGVPSQGYAGGGGTTGPYGGGGGGGGGVFGGGGRSSSPSAGQTTISRTALGNGTGGAGGSGNVGGLFTNIYGAKGGGGGGGGHPNIPGPAGTQQCAVVDEGSYLCLTAPSGFSFSTLSYGRYGVVTGACPGPFSTSPSCNATNSPGIITTTFANYEGEVCIYMDNSTFGDPCPGTSKKGVVRFNTKTARLLPGPAGAGGGAAGGYSQPFNYNSSGTNGDDAAANTGGGGGGNSGGAQFGVDRNWDLRGGNGGSGIVMIRYYGGVRGYGGDEWSGFSPGDGYTYHTFTTSSQWYT